MFYSAYTACEECADGARWRANTTETLLCEDGATLDTPTCRQVTITFAPIFENNHARKCGDFTTAQGDQCVANNRPCVRMDVECDAYDICFNTTLVNDSCSGNDALTTVSTSLSRAATRLSKAGRGCLVRSNKRDVGCDGTQIMELSSGSLSRQRELHCRLERRPLFGGCRLEVHKMRLLAPANARWNGVRGTRRLVGHPPHHPALRRRHRGTCRPCRRRRQLGDEAAEAARAGAHGVSL